MLYLFGFEIVNHIVHKLILYIIVLMSTKDYVVLNIKWIVNSLLKSILLKVSLN